MATKKTANNGNGAPSGEVTPEEAARVRSAVGNKEVAPSSRIQTIFGNWKEASDQLGSPFEVERIPLSKLRQMRRDPMLGFGLSFIKTPHVRAKWFINAKDDKGPNAQIAAHLDYDLRRVYGGIVLQHTNMLDFGFQAIAKRFEFRKPAGTYIEINPKTGEQSEKPIWSQGSIDPIAWKPFVALRPEAVEPQWNNDGEFDGIQYTPADAATALGVTNTGGGAGGSDQEASYKIDLDHSLWVTNEKDATFGSIFGYPRLGYAYRYWWSYWFRWAIADRAFERKADPSVVVRYPEGYFVDPLTGAETSYQDYALDMGSRIRSGGVIALPSEPYEDANGRGTLRQWEVEFTKDAVNFDPFDKSFEYLDVQKIRSLFIPEQAFLEGKGGTSSRNVAAEMGNSFLESQAVLSSRIADSINRFIIPQWIAVNYPEFALAGGHAEIVVQGFADEDTEFMRQLVQLLGQQDSGAKEILKLVDLQKVLEDRGTPVVSWAEQQRRDAELVKQQQNSTVGQVAPVAGQQVGTVPTKNGFSYIQPREVVYLSDTDSDFISSLPDTAHFSSKEARIAARNLNSVLTDFYTAQYELVLNGLGDLGQGNQDPMHPDHIMHNDIFDLVNGPANEEEMAIAIDDVIGILTSLISALADDKASSMGALSKISDSEIEQLIRTDSVDLIAKATDSTRKEIQDFFDQSIQQMQTDQNNQDQMSQDKMDNMMASARKHFAGYPEWKSAKSTVSEIRDIYNETTLLSAKSVGSDVVVAIEDGADEDGMMFTLDEAMEFSASPNSLISWRPLPFNFEIERGTDVSGGAVWDEETMTLSLSDSIDVDAEKKIIKSVLDEIA